MGGMGGHEEDVTTRGRSECGEEECVIVEFRLTAGLGRFVARFTDWHAVWCLSPCQYA